MSRIGKKPVPIPDGVDLDVVGGKITFRGAKCTRELDTMGRVHVTVKGRDLIFGAAGSDPQSLAFWGTYRVLANNIVVGLTSGFTKTLEISGVGYKASVAGRNLELSLGFSHPVVYPIPDGVDIAVDKSVVVIKGGDKQQVGQVAAEIRRFRPPEPYKGKGIKYSNEVIIRKAGKTSKK